MCSTGRWALSPSSRRRSTKPPNYIFLNGEHICIEENGYVWTIRTGSALQHHVITATVSDGITDVEGCVCFNDHGGDVLASWVPSKTDSPESRNNMLAMLILKTNNRIREVI
jgi:hypothetical protein